MAHRSQAIVFGALRRRCFKHVDLCLLTGAAEVGVGLRRGAQGDDCARLHPAAGAVLL